MSTTWTVVIFFLLCLVLSDACSPVPQREIGKLLIDLDEVIRIYALPSLLGYESPVLIKKAYANMIIQMWSNLLRTNDFSIKFYGERDLRLEKNSKVFDDLSKGLMYMPLRLENGRKIIYMADPRMGYIMKLEVSERDLQVLRFPPQVSHPFWMAYRLETISPIFEKNNTCSAGRRQELIVQWVQVVVKSVDMYKCYTAALQTRHALIKNAIRKLEK